jgi:hypothetical protein
MAAIKSLNNGNWIEKLQNSDNLGIHAILTNEGFGNDGSYHYTNILSGSAAFFEDQSFADTLDRIRKGNRRFQKAASPDQNLLNRTCSALNKLNSLLDHVVIIEPPFASSVWNAMAIGGYEYLEESRAKIIGCVGENTFHSFMTGKNIPNNTDCEFVDGFHGGDVTYARIISVLADRDAIVKRYVDRNYLNQFIDKNGGLASGITQLMFKIDEVDFLKIGCQKKTFL